MKREFPELKNVGIPLLSDAIPFLEEISNNPMNLKRFVGLQMKV